MKVLHVCSELYPLLKTGGLADVLGALPFAQQAIGMDTRILLPAYPALTKGIPDTEVVAEFDNFAGHVTLRYGHYQGIGISMREKETLIMMPTTMIMAITTNVLRYSLGLELSLLVGLIAGGKPILCIHTIGMQGLPQLTYSIRADLQNQL